MGCGASSAASSAEAPASPVLKLAVQHGEVHAGAQAAPGAQTSPVEPQPTSAAPVAAPRVPISPANAQHPAAASVVAPRAQEASKPLVSQTNTRDEFHAESAALHPAQTGISFLYLTEVLFGKEVPEAKAWDTNQISDQLVKRRCGGIQDPSRPGGLDGCRFTDIIPPEFVSKQTHFLSHTWSKATLWDQLQAVARYCKGNRLPLNTVFLWIDVFVLNQCDQPNTAGADIAARNIENMAKGVCEAQATLVYLDADGFALTRIWCLYEMWTCIDLRGRGSLSVVTLAKSNDMIHLLLNNIHVEKAQATKAEDLKTIWDEINGSDTKAEDINMAIKDVLMERAAAPVSLR